jgi:hypothetical protein
MSRALLATIGLGSMLALAGLTAVAAEEPAYRVAPPADWVRPVEPGDSLAKAIEGRPVDYRLVDQQIRVDGTAAGYFRYVARALNSVGVERLSQVSLNFDPEHDRLTVHRIVVRRGTTTGSSTARSRCCTASPSSSRGCSTARSRSTS